MLGTIARTTARNLLCGALCAGSFLGVQAALGDTMTYAPAEIAPSTVKTPATTALLERHDCWTDEAPADMGGQIPGHVVITVDGQPRLGGDRLVGKALDQLFGDTNHGLTVVGFCR